MMDAPGLDPRLHQGALEGLARINRLSRTAHHLWSAIERECEPASRPLRILEIGSGGGEVLVRMAARRPGHTFHGVDISSVAIEHARARAGGIGNVHFFIGDALCDETGGVGSEIRAQGTYDVVFCSLFLHHFDEVDAVKVLKLCRLYSSRLVLVDDLCRTRTGYALAWLGARLLSRSPVVHHDAPVSVAGAFTPSEARILAWAAGLARIEIATHWPERFLLTARRA